MSRWSEIRIHTTQEATEAVANILNEAGTSGVVIEDPADLKREGPTETGEIYALPKEDYPSVGVIVKGYLSHDDPVQDAAKEMAAKVRQLNEFGIDPGTGEVTCHDVQEEDWATAWKKYYKPIHVTDRLTIAPTWENYRSPQERYHETVIELDPGMAFGTGTHPSTLLCLRMLETTIKSGMHIADVGCGSGILSIASAKWGARSVRSLDLKENAVRATKANACQNHVQDRIQARQNDLLDGVKDTFDGMVANILADIIVRLSSDVVRCLKPGGFLIASGIIVEQEEMVKQALVQEGLEIEETFYEEDWVAIQAKNV